MANKVYLGQLPHFSTIAAVESHDTDVTGIKRIGVRAPDLEDAIGNSADTTAVTDPAAVEASQLGLLRGILTEALAILGAMPTGYATVVNQETANEHLSTIADKDFATQTTMAEILAKIIVAPATEAKQDTANSSLADIVTNTGAGATQVTAEAILTALADLATEAKQDTGNTALADILAKLSSDPATQTTLTEILAKMIAAPATEAKQDAAITNLTNIITKLSAIAIDGVTPSNGKLPVDIGAATLDLTGSTLTVNPDVTDRAARQLGQVTVNAGTEIIGQVKLTDGTDALLVNTNGSINIVPINSSGTELFTSTNPGQVTVNGSFDKIKAAPVVGAKTVTTTAAAIFAGSAVLANRYAMTVYNDSSYTIYWGPSGVTVSTGFPIFPGDSITFEFSPSVATSIYMIAAASAAIRVVELA